MKDKKILEEEMLSDEELDKVAGGTYDECSEIVMAVGKVVEHNGFIDNKPGKFMWYLDGNPETADYLKKTYNIDAELSGYLAPGAGGGYPIDGVANIYKINGKQISHQQVLDIIKASKG